MIIPDTNLLLYAHIYEHAQHDVAQQWWRELIAGTEPIGIPWIVSLGFVRIATNATILARPIPVTEAAGVVSEWFGHPHITPLNPGVQHLSILDELLREVGVGGNIANDAHIAALAIEYEAEVHTNDSDFARFPGLRWRNPLTAAR